MTKQAKTKLTTGDAKLSAVISDHNAQIKSGVDEQATPERGYQKTND